MSREERTDRDTAAVILTSAKEQFLKGSYEKATLRAICAGAGVSTGAFYYNFHNKEALFAALVEPTLRQLEQRFAEYRPDAGILPFLFEHRDGLRLLLEHAEGSRYEDYPRRLREHAGRRLRAYAEQALGEAPDEALIGILSDMYCSALKGFANLDVSPEEMARLAEQLSRLT
ncbi:MAG: TetR/AcrR family transcriptional regulator [Clostridia bacterium]|nr:TetR/AcrR family transcriptional regulator [Clostridia bacterium]